MQDLLKILCLSTPTGDEQRVAQMACHAGLQAQFCDCSKLHAATSPPQDPPEGHCHAAVAHWRTLQELTHASVDGKEPLSALGMLPKTLFVYGWQEAEPCPAFLQRLTGGVITGVRAIVGSARRVSIPAASRDYCRQLSGLDFDIGSHALSASFVVPHDVASIRPLVLINGLPFFAELQVRETLLVLVGCEKIADLETPIVSGNSLLPFFEQLLPLLMFLRRHYGDCTWHAEHARGCFILDDPPLRQRYGYFEFAKLHAAIGQQPFALSIAFIPWNYRRSQSKVVALLRAHQDRYSLCVHGCDHTRAEFGRTNQRELSERAMCALARMKDHERRFGVGFNPVMVFPQGIFSSAAMAALRACGYSAAVNSTIHPADSPWAAVKLRDLLDVAVCTHSGFPLFLRRYPDNIVDFAMDFFLGKPALVVEHHGYFRRGYSDLMRFLERFSALDNTLQWSDLQTIASRAALQRISERGDLEVRFCSDCFWILNDTGCVRRYTLCRTHSGGESSLEVSVDGDATEHDGSGAHWKVAITLQPGQVAIVRIRARGDGASKRMFRPGRVYKTKVLVRRHLSEFRDNYLERIGILQRMCHSASGVLRRLP